MFYYTDNRYATFHFFINISALRCKVFNHISSAIKSSMMKCIHFCKGVSVIDISAMIEFLSNNQANPQARMQAVFMLYD